MFVDGDMGARREALTPCLGVWVCACVIACLRACVRACVRACARARTQESIKTSKKNEDSQTRLGVTQEPMTDENLQMLSPLHTMLRSWDFIVKLICLLSDEVNIFSTEPNVLKDKFNSYTSWPFGPALSVLRCGRCFGAVSVLVQSVYR